MTTGDRVFSIDESVTGGVAHTRVREKPCDTLATIERPTPTVRRTERRRTRLSPIQAKNRKGERTPTEVPAKRGRKVMRKRRSGIRPEAGRLRS
jgi:hypothetical protein